MNNLMQKLFVFISLIILISCSKSKIPADEIVIAKKIYICDSLFSTAEAIVISNNQIIAWGDIDDLNQKFSSKKITKYDGYIYPGFIDAHSHFYGYGITLNKADLRNTFSLEDVVNKTVEFAKSNDDY